jgi:glutaredoxin
VKSQTNSCAAKTHHPDEGGVDPFISQSDKAAVALLCVAPFHGHLVAPPGGWSILRRRLRSMPMAQSSPEASVIKAYWQPGCTSCLMMKEFLTKHGVPFVSVNVLEDKDAFAELAMLGIRSVPIVRRGRDWANGQVLREVARVAGIAWGGAQVLPARELTARLIEMQMAAQRLFAQIPDDKLGRMLPHRPRSYAQLAYHIFNIADAFLEHEVQGLPLKEGAYSRVPPPEMNTKAKREFSRYRCQLGEKAQLCSNRSSSTHQRQRIHGCRRWPVLRGALPA